MSILKQGVMMQPAQVDMSVIGQQHDPNLIPPETTTGNPQTSTPVSNVPAQLPTAPMPTEVPAGTPAEHLRVGDVGLYLDPETHAGVINPQVKAAIVAGIHPDGFSLALSTQGRIPNRLHPKIPYAAAEENKMFTWHHRPEKLETIVSPVEAVVEKVLAAKKVVAQEPTARVSTRPSLTKR